jgi:hypothetical protein
MKFDYDEYYQRQSSGIPTYQGVKYQTGYGLGSMFKSFYRWILPMLKTHVLPVLKSGYRTMGTEVIKTAANIANDALDGKNLKSASEKRVSEAFENLSKKAKHALVNNVEKGGEKTQTGEGYKNSKKKLISSFQKNKKRKKNIDIFD